MKTFSLYKEKITRSIGKIEIKQNRKTHPGMILELSSQYWYNGYNLHI